LKNPGNLARRALVLIAALTAIVYAGDYAVVRLRGISAIGKRFRIGADGAAARDTAEKRQGRL
jgi:hypothetical protein